MINTCLF